MSKPEGGPEMPEEFEELWGVRCPDGTLLRSMDEDVAMAYPSREDAMGDNPGQARANPPAFVLVGVNPDWRERAMRAEAEVERLRATLAKVEAAVDDLAGDFVLRRTNSGQRVWMTTLGEDAAGRKVLALRELVKSKGTEE